MKLFRTLAFAGATLAIVIAGMAPRPVVANGVASTRNLLLLGGAAAAYLIIEHNRKVHEREAQAAAQEAATAEQASDASSAYHAAERAYRAEAQEVAELKKEVAYQHQVVEQQDKELAQSGAAPSSNGSIGWGTL